MRGAVILFDKAAEAAPAAKQPVRLGVGVSLRKA